MIVEAIILRGEFEEAALYERARALPPAMKSPVLRAPSMRPQDLVGLGERSDDVGRSAQLGQRELNASSRCLPGFEEDEFMLVRDDQSWPLMLTVVPGSMVAKISDTVAAINAKPKS
jgi:hypothetical protein